MKNIDEIFRNKFDGFEINPSERANTLFQEKLAKKNKKPVFTYSLYRISGIAVSLILVAGLSYYFYQNKPETNYAKTEIKTQQKNDLKIENQTEKLAIVENQKVESNIKKESIIVKQIKIEKKDKTIESVNQTNIQIEKPKTVEELPVLVTKNEISNAFTNASNDIETPKSIKNQQPEMILLVSKLQEEQKDLIVKNNEEITSFDENFEDGKKNILAKYANQIKDNLADGFIASETKNIKQKYYWIRARLNNYN